MPKIDLRRMINGGYDKLEQGKTPEKAPDPVVNSQALAVIEAEEAPWLPHGPLRTINFRKISSKRTLMEELNKTIIFNSNVDLPDFIYRPDLLDYQFFAALGENPTPDLAFAAQSMLDASIVPLDFNEGYPTLHNSPIWHRLPFETEESYRAFGLYVEQSGARSLGAIIAFPEENLKDWFHEYVWLHRARAYDVYKVVHHQRMRVSRIMDVENTHYALADRLIQAAVQQMGVADFLNWDELKDPLKMAKFLDTMTKIQRGSVGLSPTGHGTKGDDGIQQVPSVEVIMRKVSPRSEEHEQEVDQLDLLKESPDSVDMAQELIISVNTRNMQK